MIESRRHAVSPLLVPVPVLVPLHRVHHHPGEEEGQEKVNNTFLNANCLSNQLQV
jgi:hypothetical protein